MTNLSPIDELALPSELARQRRLDPADWLLREVQIVWPSRGDLLIEMFVGPPQLSAVLQPRNVQAIKQFNTI